MKRVKQSLVRTAAAFALTASLVLPSAIPLQAAAETTGQTSAAAAEAATVRIDPEQVVQNDFLGVGVNVIPANLMKGTTQFGYTDAHWEMDRKRILTVRPKVARLWFQIDWMEPEKGVYTWDSPEMQGFYAYLDAFKEAGTEIELDFGWKNGSAVHDWFTFPDVSQAESAPADLDAYAASASVLLKQLLDERGYSNIKYLTFYNEPNGSWDFEAPGDQQAYYAEMARKVSDRLEADGLRSRIEIWGPEESGAPAWTQYMSENAGDVFDAYSFHVYGESYDGLGSQIQARESVVQGKPVNLTEFGWSDDNASNWTAGYANTVIQAANSGVESALIWQLNGTWSPDPFGGTNGGYTLWDSLLLGMQPRKTFYIGGLLNRYIPAHSSVLKVETDSPDVRAAAFRSQDGNYTILLESKEGATKDVTFDFGGLAVNKTFSKHEFRDDVELEGNAVLPPSSGTFAAGTSFHDAGIGDEYSVVVYTTAPSATQVKVTPLTPTVKSGDKLQLSAEVVDNTGGVAWSIVDDKTGQPKNKGEINKNTGVFHAPDVTDETYIAVKAASKSDPSAYGISLIKVLPKSLPNTVEVPQFSLEPGVYSSAEALFLTSATPGAQIRYTTDGSEPTESSSLYTKPIILENGSLALYKAKAFKTGLKPSGTTSSLYEIGDVSNAPDGYSFCMYEGQGSCDFEGQAIVAFGADGLFNYKVLTDGAECSADVFGDPAPGVPKRCFYSKDIPEELPVVTFYNAGFEKPATTSARWGPMTNGWTFTERAGVQHNGSVFQPSADAPQGVQSGYLKTDGGVNGWFSQSINFKPGTYQLSFQAAKRMSYGGTQTFDVYFDDTVIGSYAPTTGEYVLYRSEPFTTEGGYHVIKFAATSTTGDNTAFIDDIRIGLPVEPEAPYIANASFETPTVADGSAASGVTAGWSFDDNAGILRGNGGQGAPSAPLGVQAAYARQGGALAQSVEFPAGTYVLHFQAATDGSQAVEVRVDDQFVGTYAPAAGGYQSFESPFITVEAGPHEIRLTAAGGEGTAWIDGVGIERIAVPEVAELANGGFETPAVTSGNGVKVGGTAGWTFGTTAGMIRNGSVFGAADAPEGTQAGYLQTVNGLQGEFSQSGIFPAGTYVITFQAAKRAGYGGQQRFAVYVDDEEIGTFEPSSGSYAAYETGSFTFAEPGKHEIRFAALTTTGDNTAFIDDIAIEPAPAA